MGRTLVKICLVTELMTPIYGFLEKKRWGARGPMLGMPHVMSNRECHGRKWLQMQSGSKLVPQLKNDEIVSERKKGLTCPGP